MSNETDNLELEAEQSGTSQEDQESATTTDSTGDDETSTTPQNESDPAKKQTEENNWFVPGRFRTPDDVLQSYRNLESAYGQSQSELQRLRRQSDQAQAQTDPDEELKEFATKVKEHPVKAIREVARREFAQELDSIKQGRFVEEYTRAMQNPDFARLEPIMTQAASYYKDVIDKAGLNKDPRLFDILYTIARGIDAQSQTQAAAAKGKEQGTKEALKKQKMQVEGASGSRGRSTRKFEDLTREEMEKEIAAGNI